VAAWGGDIAFFDAGRGHDDAPGPASSSPSLRVVGVGTLSWVHGYEWALQAIRQLLDLGIDCQYRIVGDGPYREALSFARSELELEDRVELVGFASKEQLREELRRADVLVDATVVHGQPSAVPEGQAMALPIVVTGRTDVSSAALDSESGFVVEPRDPGVLAEKLALLALDPERRRRMGAAGRRGLLARPAAERKAAAFDRLYRTALKGGSGEVRSSLR
jgi:colanic acid/amylovoran biosynthesis glycosyltransferase